MFYQCPKCKKNWQYPIEKCPDCFSVLEKISSDNIKVVGISRVNVPTILHTEIPYFVLVLEDDKGNRWVQKSVIEYKIGQEYKLEASKNKNSVSIWRIKYDILEAIEIAVNLLGGLNPKEDSRILILPTIVSATHPYFRDNTSPKFLEATIKFLFVKGVKPENVKVGAQSFDEVPIEAKAQKSQLLDVCLQNKVIPLDLTKSGFIKRNKNNLDLEISEEALKSDIIINLPILKRGRTMASENILTLLKKENYLAPKYLSSDKKILGSLNSLLLQYLTIAEANVIQDSEKFVHHLGLILASFSPLNLDRIFFEILKEKELPEILKEIKIEDVPILGREIEEVNFKPTT